MTFTDEELMAYADGELDEARRQQIQDTIARDPEVARRVNAHRALKDSLRVGFEPVLEEPVPDRLVAIARSRATRTAQPDVGSAASAGGPDAGFGPAESQADARSNPPEGQPDSRSGPSELHSGSKSNVVPLRGRRVPAPSRPKWIALAASFLFGALALQLGLRYFSAAGLTPGGELSAPIQQALSSQLASTPSTQTGLTVGVSFLSKTGQYCRTFTLQSLAGLACNDAGDWKVQVLAHARSPGAEYRQAGSNMPPAILQAVTDTIAGAPLDATDEAHARAQKWQHPK